MTTTSIPSVITDTASLPIRKRVTMAFDRRSPYTNAEIEFSEAEKTQRLETRYALLDKPRDESFRTPEGDSFRSAGSLYLRTCRDGVRRFIAYMHEGSIHHDFQYFDRVINDAKFGRMHGWVRHTFNDGDEGWAFEYPDYQIDNLDLSKPARLLIEESSNSPTIVGYGAMWGYPCDESRCRESVHESEEANHTLDSLDNQLTKRGGYEIEICKDMTKPDSDWFVNLWANGDLTELTPEQIATLANDLQWMGLECATTNAKQCAA